MTFMKMLTLAANVNIFKAKNMLNRWHVFSCWPVLLLHK